MKRRFGWARATVSLAVAVTASTLLAPIEAMGAPMPADTTASRQVELQEITVNGRRATVVDDGMSFVVAPSDRQGAVSPLDIVGRMQLPTLRYDRLGRQLSTIDGSGISYFINGMPSDAQEVAAQRPRDVLRVVVLHAPTDPKYNGASCAVDFIVRQYDYGGFASMEATQHLFPIEGEYDAYGQYHRRGVTISAFGHAEFQNLNHRSRSFTSTTMDMTPASGGGEPYVLTKQQESVFTKMRTRKYWGGLKLVSQPEGGRHWVSVAAGLKRLLLPVQDYSGTLAYDHEDAPQQDRTTMAFRMWLPYTNFAYSLTTLRHQVLHLGAGVSLGRTDQDQSYASTGLDAPLLNSSREDMVQYNLGLTFYQPLAGKYLYFFLHHSGSFYRTRYAGTADLVSRSRVMTTQLQAGYTFTPAKGWSISPRLSTQCDATAVRPQKPDTRWQWTARVDVRGSLSKVNSLYVFGVYFPQLASIAGLSDVRQQTSADEGVAGDPNPGYIKTLNLKVTDSWTPSGGKVFTLGTTLAWRRRIHNTVLTYFCQDGVMYNRFTTSGTWDQVQLNVNPSIRLFGARTRINPYFQISYERQTGLRPERFWNFTTTMGVTQSIGDKFTATASVTPPWYKSLSGGTGNKVEWRSWSVNLNAGWTPCPSWAVDMYIAPFPAHRKTVTIINAGVYRSTSRDVADQFVAMVTARYTVDFGKRIEHQRPIFEGTSNTTVR